MRSSTLYFPRPLTERDVAVLLEVEFDAGWMPEYHRIGVSTPDGTVVVDFDAEFMGRLTLAEQQVLEFKLGFLPETVLHLHESIYHSGSAALAEQVTERLCGVFGGQRGRDASR